VPTPTATTHAATKAYVDSAVGKNKIINGNFIVNQRVYVTNTETASGVYTHDRWKAGSSGCKYTFTTANVPTTITIPASDSLIQVIEGINLETATYTVSWSGTSQGKEAGGTYADSGFTVSCTAGTNLTLEFDDGTLTNVQMEKGSVATPYEHRLYGDELARCQRYYQQFADRHMGLTASSSQTYTGGASLMVEMRAIPTLEAGSFAVGGGSTGTPALNQNPTAATSSTEFAMIYNSAANWNTATYVEFSGGLQSEL
jgi:hypothetical protein